MDSRNACIKLEGKHLIFEGGIRKSDTRSLSNIFILNEMLMKEMDELNNKTFKCTYIYFTINKASFFLLSLAQATNHTRTQYS
ncbi:hypothetical protein [Wocania ichthyoenteri]|uniref:hypothetical protein n=1 Tax=Wocania ichthyoenteri TaxID=1230531 RepID=UPI00053ED246|nr:hypothetical protein [Wocania ichthyoenteri]